MAKVGVVGSGTWGSALTLVLSENGHDVTVWSKFQDEIDMLNRTHEHNKLPGVILPDSVCFTTDLKAAVEGMDLVVIAVPSVFVRNTAREMKPFVKEGQILTCVSKGIEESTQMILSDQIEQEIPQAVVTVLSGPSHAEEVGKRIPTTLVVGAKCQNVARKVQDIFMSNVLRVYTSPDMLGIEIGAALKNVIALAAGVLDGVGFGDNTKAALITRGMAEIARLGVAMGGNAHTFYGLSGIGDLIVTCESRHSRNRMAGYLIGQGRTLQEALDEVGMVVEGVYSAKAALALAQKYGINMPIVETVNQVLFDNLPVMEAVNNLMSRNKKDENSLVNWDEI